MKKLLFLTTICLLILTVGHAQTNIYHAFPDSNAVWAIQWYIGGPPPATNIEWYSIKGDDTIINSLTYKKINYGKKTIGGIRQNIATKKVYFIAFSNFASCPGACYNSECLLYDFNAGVGDTVFYGLGGYRNKVASIDSIQLVDGTYRKRFKEAGSVGGIIEGIGSTHSVLCGWASGMTTFDLSCFKQNDTTLYLFPPNSTCPILTDLQEVNWTASSLLISPNPFSIQTTLKTDRFFINTILTIDNCFGQTVKQIKNISGKAITLQRDNLPSGLYFIRLMQGNKIIGADKLVIIDN